jgi:hypothetical protein
VRLFLRPKYHAPPTTWEAADWVWKKIGLTLDRRSHKLHQVVPPERFGKKTNCAAPHRFVTIRPSALRTDEHDRHAIIGSDQLILKFQAVNAWQLYVENEKVVGPAMFHPHCQSMLDGLGLTQVSKIVAAEEWVARTTLRESNGLLVTKLRQMVRQDRSSGARQTDAG